MKKTGAIPGFLTQGFFYGRDMSRRSIVREPGFFSGGLALSLGLHAGLAALVLLGGAFHPPASPPVLTVSLVAPESTHPGAGGSLAAAGTPGVQKTTSSPPLATLAPPAPPPAQPKPMKRQNPRGAPVSRARPQPTLMPLPPRPAPTHAVQAPEAPSTPTPVSGPVAAPFRGQSSGPDLGGRQATAGRGAAGTGSGAAYSAVLGGGQGGGGNPAAAQRRYLNLIRTRILAQRKYPYMARQRRQEGVVRLRFTLSPAGALSQGVQIVKPSGYNLLDEQARQCVLAAAPFPPFPVDLQQERLAVELPIIYKISGLDR